jgi:hypothetical protein
MKKGFADLKRTKSRAVEVQKKYLKCCEKQTQFLYGTDNFKNFMFIQKKEQETQGLLGWSFIEGFTASSNRQIRYHFLSSFSQKCFF